jgi:hypothetical protein
MWYTVDYCLYEIMREQKISDKLFGMRKRWEEKCFKGLSDIKFIGMLWEWQDGMFLIKNKLSTI